MTNELIVRNVHVVVGDTEILRGVDLTVRSGEIHAMMGPNGSGKSTLAYAIMGHPYYEVTEGEILFNGEDVTEMEADERAKAGIFLAFQYPTTVPGVSMANFLRTAISSVRGYTDRKDGDEDRIIGSNLMPMREFRKELQEKMKLLGINPDFARRYLNEGFSGGEKKRAEVLQMAMLEPKLAIMDETDSGLDIDALRTVADGVNKLIARSPEMGVLLITHYQRLLNYIEPHHVHVFYGGRVVKSGGPELAHELDEKGYDWVSEELAAEAEAAPAPV